MKTESQILTALENAYRAEYEAAQAIHDQHKMDNASAREVKRTFEEAEAKRYALNKFREIAMRAIYPNG